jgi:selenocysteine-specific elongation factor
VAQQHQHSPDQQGVSRARLKRIALPSVDDQLIYLLINQLVTQGELHNSHGWLHLPEYSLSFDASQQALWCKTESYLTDEPRWVRELATEVQVDENQMRSLLYRAAQQGLVIAIVRDRYFLRQRIRQFADLIRALHQTQGHASAADFRDQLGIGRKLAIQILEFFDRCGFTRRKENTHLLRDEEMFKE